MKKTIEVVPELDRIVRITKSDLISKLEKDPLSTLSAYSLDESLLFDLIEFIPVEVFLQTIDPSEDLVKKLLDIKYLKDEDLNKLSLSSIYKMSKEFLESKINFLNFDRIILNFSSTDDEFFIKNDPQPYIDMSSLHGPYFWRILSSNRLSKKTILDNLNNLDWVLLCLNNTFSDFSEEEFKLINPYLDKLELSKNIEVTLIGDPIKTLPEISNIIKESDLSENCKIDEKSNEDDYIDYLDLKIKKGHDSKN